ncbi:ABC transporter ATP-binding protein [Paenibacillus senegalensis]|uniref:ABC transporter ATP-binding protein n=1 Tax=Paenibacillus senegalensis TaxID=1465766 RepID=UPI000289D246|nr:ABC transporter ATP-binding protein [Paenibacillus senegalensis]
MRYFPKAGRYTDTPLPAKGSIGKMYRQMFFHVRQNWKLLLIVCGSIICIALLEFFIPQLTRHTIDHVIPQHRYDWLGWIAAGILGAALMLGIFRFLSSYLMSIIGQRAIYRMRNDLYRHIQSMDIAFFDRNRTGDLMSRVTSDVNMLQQLISSGMISIVTDVVIFFAIAGYMLYTEWQLAAILLATFPFMLLLIRFFGKRLRAAYKKVQESVAKVSNHLQDSLSGIRLVKAFATEEYENSRFSNRNEANMTSNLRASKLSSLFGPLIDQLNYVGLAAVIVFGAWLAMNGRMTTGEIVAFIAYLRLLQNPVRQFSRAMNLVQQSAAAYERIMEIMETKAQVRDSDTAKPLPPIQGRIVFHNVDFAYQEDVPVLKQFSLEIEPGQLTALVGSSGAGKSTIAHLIARLYDPVNGSITIDGHPLREVTTQSLRQQLGIVSQDVILMNGTIRDNIAYGKPDAAEADIIAAAKAANAHEFITSFPKGYDSQVGERGVRLSGGQKQRLSIARAILRNPRLVILDEATSALDTESELLIQEALEKLLSGRTSIVIAHRLSTIQKADRILVLEKGRLLEAGTHEELLRHSGRYRQLYDMQFPQSRKRSEQESAASSSS